MTRKGAGPESRSDDFLRINFRENRQNIRYSLQLWRYKALVLYTWYERDGSFFSQQRASMPVAHKSAWRRLPPPSLSGQPRKPPTPAVTGN